MDLPRLFKLIEGLPDEEALPMILGNRIDMGSSDGGLISVSQFDRLAQDLIAWRDWSNAQRGLMPATGAVPHEGTSNGTSAGR